MADLKDLYRKALADQFPQGDSFEAKDIPSSNLYKLIHAFAELFNLMHCRSTDLAVEFFPDSSTELAENWEDELYQDGIFSCINDLPLTQQEKIRALIADAYANGGNRVEYYQEIALRLGFDLTVVENSPTIFEAELHINIIDGVEDLFTKPVLGSGQVISIPAVSQTLGDLGVTIDPATKAIEIVLGGNVNDYKQLINYRETGQDPTGSEGIAGFTHDRIKFSKDQFTDLRMRSLSGSTTAYLVQYEQEFRYLQTQRLCDYNLCQRLTVHDLDPDLHTLKCLLKVIMPAHLIFNIFVNGQIYDIVKPV